MAQRHVHLDNWGSEFVRILLIFAVITVFVWAIKTPTLQNIPALGNLFKWWGKVFGGGQD